MLTIYLTRASFLLSLFFLVLSANGQNEETLLKDLANARHDSDRANIYVDLHNAVFKTDLIKAEEYAEKVVEYGKLSGSPKREITGYRALARCKRKTRDYPKVLYYDSLAMQVALKVNIPVSIFTMEIDFSSDYMDGKMPAQSVSHLKNAEKIALQQGESSWQAKANNRLGWFYAMQYQHTKAIPYFEKALEAYEKLGDQKMIAETKWPYTESLVAIGKTTKVPELLFGAIDYFRKANALSSLGSCLVTLGHSYYQNGDPEKALEHFLEAKKLFATYNNQPDIGMVATDIAGTYLSTKDMDKALSYGNEAEKILNDAQYEPGLVSLYTFWGRYYTETNELSKAEIYFDKASALAVKNNLPDQLTDNMRYSAILKRRQKDNKGADSLEMKYADRIVTEREQATILNDLKENITRNKIKDTNTIKLLSLMYSPGGVSQLRKQLNGRTLSDIIQLDTLLLSNYELNNPENLSRSKEFNRQLLDVETQYKTRLIADSLTIEKQNNLLAKQEAKNRTIINWLALALCLLLSGGLWLQFRSRKKAEAAKKQIELLQNEIHHRVKNNLAVLRRLVQVAGDSAGKDMPVQSLQNRVAAFELLHKHLYQNETSAGKISQQRYLQELCNLIENTFDRAGKIMIHVNAPIELNIEMTEKIGLIINELVTNSFKYAFINSSRGRIDINLQQLTTTQYQLTFSDDGIGFDTSKKYGSYGLKLIAGLSNGIDGIHKFITNNGTRFELVFNS